MAMYCECPKCSGEETDDNFFEICNNDMMYLEMQSAKLKMNAGTYPIIIGVCLFIIFICSIGIATIA